MRQGSLFFAEAFTKVASYSWSANRPRFFDPLHSFLSVPCRLCFLGRQCTIEVFGVRHACPSSLSLSFSLNARPWALVVAATSRSKKKLERSSVGRLDRREMRPFRLTGKRIQSSLDYSMAFRRCVGDRPDCSTIEPVISDSDSSFALWTERFFRSGIQVGLIRYSRRAPLTLWRIWRMIMWTWARECLFWGIEDVECSSKCETIYQRFLVIRKNIGAYFR